MASGEEDGEGLSQGVCYTGDHTSHVRIQQPSVVEDERRPFFAEDEDEVLAEVAHTHPGQVHRLR